MNYARIAASAAFFLLAACSPLTGYESADGSCPDGRKSGGMGGIMDHFCAGPSDHANVGTR